MPFGFKNKDKAEDEKRSALFGSRSKNSKSPAPPANPYAVPASSNDPYASKPVDPYTEKPSSGSLSQPPSYDSGPNPQLRREKSPVPPGGYGGGAPRYGGGGSYDQQGGYGGNVYGNEPQQQPQSRYGAGGYGGLGRSNSQDTTSTDAGRAALFGDAPQRQARQPAQSPGATGQDNSYGGGQGSSTGQDGYVGTDTSSFGGYGQDRELTAEEQEEEDIQATKSEIKFLKQQDVASTRNAMRIAQQAEETGRATLERLGQQGERIHNTERNLDMASAQNRLAQEKARELKTLNRSMFAVHVSNPFTAKRREEDATRVALEHHQAERRRADATRQEAYGTTARQAQLGRELNKGGAAGANKASLAQRSKYQFEADSEDDEMEGEIESNLESLHTSAKTLNRVARAMGDEVDDQNKHVRRIIGKADEVDDQIAQNRHRINQIR